MNDVWTERDDTYSESTGAWTEKHTGFYKTPKGLTRSCGHHHADEQKAEQCARALYYRTLKESR